VPATAWARLRENHQVLTAEPAALGSLLPDAVGLLALLTLRVDAALLEAAPRLRVVANFAVGFDNIDVDACTHRGVVVTHTPNVLTETTADLAFALLMAVARRLPEGERKVRAGEWKGFAPDFLLGTDVWGKTLGIIGMGRIGRAVARRAQGFAMRILYSGRHPADGAPGEQVTLDALLEQSDFVSLHCPLGPLTRHLIGAPELARMKPGAILINTARGAIVDEAALIEWLARGGRAALDVFEQEPQVPAGLLASERVVLSPHVGSATVETRARMADLAACGIEDVLAGRRPAYPVNPILFD
jgi:glyoxylate reductase